jgi:predicted ribosomally synthesized peptide with nif11-like leader
MTEKEGDRRVSPLFVFRLYEKGGGAMSIESAAAFYDRLQNDDALQEQLKATGNRVAMEAYVRDELGYDFTKEEMQKVIFERNPEMTDEELEAVVGGVSDDMLIGISIGVSVGGGMGVIALAAVAAAA